MFKKILILLFLLPTFVRAEWIEVTKVPNNKIRFFAEIDTKEFKDKKVRMWVMVDWKSNQYAGEKKYKSTMNQFQYDCENLKHRIISTVFYTNNLRQGDVIYSAEFENTSEWRNIRLNTPENKLWKVACESN